MISHVRWQPCGLQACKRWGEMLGQSSGRARLRGPPNSKANPPGLCWQARPQVRTRGPAAGRGGLPCPLSAQQSPIEEVRWAVTDVPPAVADGVRIARLLDLWLCPAPEHRLRPERSQSAYPSGRLFPSSNRVHNLKALSGMVVSQALELEWYSHEAHICLVSH